MSEPIRVLQVIGKMDRGGAESMIMNLYREIDKEKVQFDFLVHTTAEGKFDAEIKKMGGKIHRVQRCKLNNVISYYKECDAFFKSHPEYKIVHGHIGSCASYYLLAAKRNGCYTIAHSHSAAATKSFKDFLYNVSAFPTRYIADQLFGCSTEAGQARYGKRSVKWKKYMNFANGIDLDKFYYNTESRIKIRNEFNVKEDELVVGTIGRLTPQKNPHMLYDVFKKLVTLYPNVKCLWIGTGELEDEIKSWILSDNLQAKIIMTGVRSDVHELVQGMDCFLFPSLWEGLPVTVIEAQAADLPCVLSDTISKEVAVTDLIEWHSLKESSEMWAKRCMELAKQSKNVLRVSPKEEIRRSGYDIYETSRWLSEFYIKHNK